MRNFADSFGYRFRCCKAAISLYNSIKYDDLKKVQITEKQNMTELVRYEDSRSKSMIYMIASFFADHFSISENEHVEVTQERLSLAEENLQDWLSEEETNVFFIEEDGLEAGILILKTHGGSVVWIEDLYVKKEMRNHGIASRAIALAEKYAKDVMRAPAICMDVIPQNEAAIKLYHSLGYDTISMVTLRKSISEAKRNNSIQFLGYEFFK